MPRGAFRIVPSATLVFNVASPSCKPYLSSGLFVLLEAWIPASRNVWLAPDLSSASQLSGLRRLSLYRTSRRTSPCLHSLSPSWQIPCLFYSFRFHISDDGSFLRTKSPRPPFQTGTSSQALPQYPPPHSILTVMLTFCGVQVAPFLWAGQCTFNWSLALTSVSSNTILSSTGSIFTFILSLVFLKETFYWYKVVSLAMCFAGNAINVSCSLEQMPK